MEEKFADLLAQVKKNHPEIGSAGLNLIKKAYQLAFKAHEGQKRLTGDDFINHPLAVAEVLVGWRLGSEAIAAGFLHDVVEEGNVSLAKIEKEFGLVIADLVDGVTKVGEYKLRGQSSQIFVENLRKLIVVMAHDLRVVLIKLADRYHNMQSLDVFPPEKQKRIARETLEVYAPLAERLGIGETKGQLEDLAFPYLYPKEYQWLKNYSRPFFKKADKHLKKVKRKIVKILAKEGIRAKVDGRRKHLFSLYQKLLRSEIGKEINKVYDLVALRIIVQTVEECYTALGVVHKFFKPVPAIGIRDFIAQPKPNGYQSIHTNVFCFGRITEIQIRTREMHEEAENGIAAHWYFGQQKAGEKKDKVVEAGFFVPTQKMAWVNQLMGWQKEITDSQEFIDSLKFDALKHRHFIFSPKGDVFDLPAGATPVDFAYAVHSDVGDSCCGAKVDGKMAPLDCKLKSGQVVEIIRSKTKKAPSRDWLNFVVTQTAKQRIEKHFRRS